MDEALREARAALVRQIKRKPVINRLASLTQVERGEKPSPVFNPLTDLSLKDLMQEALADVIINGTGGQKLPEYQYQQEILNGITDAANRRRILGAPPPPDTLGGVYGTRADMIWVDDIAEDAKYAGKVKIVDPDKYAGKVSAGRITTAVPPPPKLNPDWPPKLNNDWMYPPPFKVPTPPPPAPAPQPNIAEKLTAVAAVDHEYEQFKVWLYRMIAEAQDDLSPAFVYSVAKIKFQPLREAVANVVKLSALTFMKEDRKRRLVEFQQWVDRVKPETTWQVTGKELLSNLARVIDPYAT